LWGTTYQKPDQFVGVVAIPPDLGWEGAFTYQISAPFLTAFRNTRTGALVRAELAEKYHWKVGDRIPLLSTVAKKDGTTDWAFDIVGTYTDTDLGGGRDVIIINYAYYDEARAANTGRVNHFNLLISDPKQAVRIEDEVDRRFANSSNQTRTESLLELAQSQLQAIGDLNFLVRAVIATVLVALLFSTATMTMQSIRERIPELGVLKTIGFTDRTVFILILCEATVVFVLAAGCGLALANVVFPLAARFVPGLSMPLVIVLAGLAAAAVLALISTAVPATLAARLKIVSALTGR